VTDQPLDLEAERSAQDLVAEDRSGEPRARLDEEAQALAAQLDALDGLDHGTESSTFDDNFADSGQVAAEQGENRALAAQLREQLDDVERAIAKLDDGTYGACEVCGMAIGDSRLEAMPATRFCIEHAAG
jgi:DnaK suppressor protein